MNEFETYGFDLHFYNGTYSEGSVFNCSVTFTCNFLDWIEVKCKKLYCGKKYRDDYSDIDLSFNYIIRGNVNNKFQEIKDLVLKIASTPDMYNDKMPDTLQTSYLIVNDEKTKITNFNKDVKQLIEKIGINDLLKEKNSKIFEKINSDK